MKLCFLPYAIAIFTDRPTMSSSSSENVSSSERSPQGSANVSSASRNTESLSQQHGNAGDGARNIRSATVSLREQLDSGNLTLEEAHNNEGHESPDVLFRGGFAQGFPNFSVTIDRTNITPNGTVTGEPIFNFDNLPNNLRDLVESVMRSGRPRKKQATKDAIKSLKVIDPSTLKESERSCPICYDKFDELKYGDNNEQSGEGNHLRTTKYRDFIDSDPPMWFPTDATASTHSEYHRLATQSLEKEDDSENNEHVPVKMPCGHIFGRSCLLEWLKSNISCPLCRSEVESQSVQTSDQTNIDISVIRNRSMHPANWAERENLYEDPGIPFASYYGGLRTAPGAIRR